MGPITRKSARNAAKRAASKPSFAVKRRNLKRGRTRGKKVSKNDDYTIVKQNKPKGISLNEETELTDECDDNTEIEFLEEFEDESVEGSINGDDNMGDPIEIKDDDDGEETPEGKIKLINVNVLMEPQLADDDNNEGSQVRVIEPYYRGTWVMYRDYPYTIREKRKNIVVYHCPRKGCSGRFFVHNEMQTVNGYRAHNHLPDKWVPYRNAMYQELKRRTSTENTPLKQIYDEVAARHEEGAKHLPFSESTMRTWRHHVRQMSTSVPKAKFYKGTGTRDQVKPICGYQRSVAWIMYKKYPYSLREKKTNGTSYVCPHKKCPARIYVRSDCDKVNEYKRHDHKPDWWVRERNELYHALKRRAKVETTPLKHIYNEESVRYPDGARHLPFPESTMRQWRTSAIAERTPKSEPKTKVFRGIGSRDEVTPICGYQRDIPWLIYKNYPYQHREKKANGTSYVCPRKTCPARIFLRSDSDVVKEYKTHEHKPDTWVPQRNELYAALRRRSMMESTPIRQIYNEETARHPVGAMHLPYPESTMRQWRSNAAQAAADCSVSLWDEHKSITFIDADTNSDVKPLLESLNIFGDPGSDNVGSDTEIKSHASSSDGISRQMVRRKKPEKVRGKKSGNEDAISLIEAIPSYKEDSTWIIFKTYPYFLKNRIRDETRFACYRPDCEVKLLIRDSSNRVHLTSAHDHPPDTWIKERNQLYQSLMSRASNEPNVPPRKIYCEEAEKFPEGAKHVLYSDALMQTWRQKQQMATNDAQASDDEYPEVEVEWLEDFEEECSDGAEDGPQRMQEYNLKKEITERPTDEEYADSEDIDFKPSTSNPKKRKVKDAVYYKPDELLKLLEERKSSFASKKKRKVEKTEPEEEESDASAWKTIAKMERNVTNAATTRKKMSTYKILGSGQESDLEPIAPYHRSSTWVMYQRYPFYLRERKQRGISYKCPYKGCYARLFVHNRTGVIDQYSRHHHLPESWIPERNLLYQALRRRSFNELTPLKAIYKEEIARFPEGAKHLRYLESSMRLWRKRAMVAMGIAEIKNNQSDLRIKAAGHESEVIPISPYRIGSTYVMYRDYPYSLREKKAVGTSYVCTKEGCRARIYIRRRTGAVDEYRQHQHPPDTWVVERNEMYQAVRRRTLAELTPIKDIFEQEAARFPEGAKHLPYLGSSMRSWRNNRKTVPVNLLQCQGNSFVKVTLEGETAVIMTSDNYERVAACCHTLLVDSSFRALPGAPLVQKMVAVHAVVGDRASCPVIILLESKSTALCDAALARVCELAGFNSVTNVYVGYDEPLNGALRAHFRSAKFHEHFHHYAQAVVRLASTRGVDFRFESHQRIVRMLVALAFVPRSNVKTGLLYVQHSAGGATEFRAFFNAYCDYWTKTVDIQKISVHKDPERTSDIINNFQCQLLKKIAAGHKSRSPNDWWQFINSVQSIQKSLKPYSKNYECLWNGSNIQEELKNLLSKEITIPEFLLNIGQLLDLEHLFTEPDSLSKLNIEADVSYLETNEGTKGGESEEFEFNDEDDQEILDTFEKSNASETYEDANVIEEDLVTDQDNFEVDNEDCHETDSLVSASKKKQVRTCTRGVNTVGFYFIKGLPIADDDDDNNNPNVNVRLTKTKVSHSRNTTTRATSPKISKSLLREHGLLKPIPIDSPANYGDEEVSQESDVPPEEESGMEDECSVSSHESISQTAMDSDDSHSDISASSVRSTENLSSTITTNVSRHGAKSNSVAPSQSTNKRMSTGSTPVKGKPAVSNSPRLIPVVFKPLASGTPSKSLSISKTPKIQSSQVIVKSGAIRTDLVSKVTLAKKSSSKLAKVAQESTDRCPACVIGIGEELCMVCGYKT